MEIDREEAISGGAAGVNRLQVNSTGAESREDGEQRRDAKHEIMKLTRLAKFDGKGGPKAYWVFVRNMRAYLSMVNGTAEEKIFIFSHHLTGDAQEWWDLKCMGPRLVPEDIRTVEELYAAFAARFEPKTTRESALRELQNLKQGKLPLSQYVDKFKSLLHYSGVRDEQLMYRWLIKGLSENVRSVAINWATTETRLGGQPSIAALQNFLLEYADKDVVESIFNSTADNEPDGEPMDIGAVNTKRPAAAKRDNKDGAGTTEYTKPFRHAKRCNFCGNPGHLIAQCRRVQEARKLQREAYQRRREANNKSKEDASGNAKAPMQPAPA